MPDHCRGEHKTGERRKKRLTALETGAECCWSRLRGLANRDGQDGFAFDRDLVIAERAQGERHYILIRASGPNAKKTPRSVARTGLGSKWRRQMPALCVDIVGRGPASIAATSCARACCTCSNVWIFLPITRDAAVAQREQRPTSNRTACQRACAVAGTRRSVSEGGKPARWHRAVV